MRAGPDRARRDRPDPRAHKAINNYERELAALVKAHSPQLLELPGCQTLTAAKLIGETGPISRFRTASKYARFTATAPIPASSGNTNRHRLDRGGNRQLNAAIHRIAITQIRWHPPANTYYQRKLDDHLAAVEQAIASQRCDVHGERATVRRVRSGDSFKFKISGCCDDLVRCAQAAAALVGT